MSTIITKDYIKDYLRDVRGIRPDSVTITAFHQAWSVASSATDTWDETAGGVLFFGQIMLGHVAASDTFEIIIRNNDLVGTTYVDGGSNATGNVVPLVQNTDTDVTKAIDVVIADYIGIKNDGTGTLGAYQVGYLVTF